MMTDFKKQFCQGVKGLQPFWIALSLLTRIPVGQWISSAPDANRQGQSVLYYPVVGFIIGGVLCIGQWLLGETSVWLQAAMLLSLWVMMTGCLHLDGLADSVDAWIGGYGDRARTLAIMRDPYCGPVAVVVLVLVLLLKWVGLVLVLAAPQLGWYLLLAPVMGRVAIIGLFLTTPYIRADGMGAMAAKQLPIMPAISVMVGIVFIVLLTLGYQGLWLLSIGFVVGFLLRRVMVKRLGGMTGDTTGALVELTEVVFLVAAVLLL